MNPIRYATTDVPVSPWLIQGSTYVNSTDAKFAAARLYTAEHISGVVVKLHKGLYAVFYRAVVHGEKNEAR